MYRESAVSEYRHNLVDQSGNFNGYYMGKKIGELWQKWNEFYGENKNIDQQRLLLVFASGTKHW